jgi:hypothetical protein
VLEPRDGLVQSRLARLRTPRATRGCCSIVARPPEGPMVGGGEHLPYFIHVFILVGKPRQDTKGGMSSEDQSTRSVVLGGTACSPKRSATRWER